MPETLRKASKQVLGLNARSLKYTGHNNLSTSVKTAGDKLLTKKVLQKAGVSTPRLYATINSRQELSRFRWTKLPSSFVLKPRSSYGGGGIVVIFGRNKKGNWVKADKTEVFIPELRKHVLDILDGNFSSSNVPDTALFEQRIRNHPDLKAYSKQGVADLRIIVYNKVPVMAMLRLPTLDSRGKANLHVGGIGVGIDLAKGYTTTAIQHGHVTETIPGTRLHLSGIRIPHWKEVLLMSVKAAEALNLAYAGVDIALDREDGPTVLEVNARPGLGIQLANMAPLFSRLQRVEGLKVSSAEKGVRIGKNLFGGDYEQELEDITGQQILGFKEDVEVFDIEGTPHTITAKIDTGAWRTTIDEILAKKYNLYSKINPANKKKVRAALGREERIIIDLNMRIRDRSIKTEAFIADRSYMKYGIIIGRRDLKGFLVDPARL